MASLHRVRGVRSLDTPSSSLSTCHYSVVGSEAQFAAGAPHIDFTTQRTRTRSRRPQASDLDISVLALSWAKYRVWWMVFVGAVTLAVALYFVVTSLTATTWNYVSDSASQLGPFTGITCAPSGACIVTDRTSQIVASNTHSTHFQVGAATSDGFDPVGGASCSPIGCVVVSRNGDLWQGPNGLELNAGSSADPSSGPGITSVSCGRDRFVCVAVGNSFGADSRRITVTTLATCGFNCIGVQKQSVMHVTNGAYPSDVDCVSGNWCFAMGPGSDGSSFWRTEDAGLRWTRVGTIAPPPADNEYTQDISCVSRTTCMVSLSNAAVAVTTDGGRQWSFRSIPQWGHEQQTCSGSAEYCSENAQLDEQGGEWGSETASAVWCVTPLRCLVGSSGTGSSTTQTGYANPPMPNGGIVETTNGGRSWSTMSMPSGVVVNALACTAHDGCFAVGSTTQWNSQTGVILHLSSF